MSRPMRRRESESPPKRRKPKAGRVSTPPPSRGRLRAFRLGEGIPAIPSMMEEIQDMTDVLLGREPPPLDNGYLTLMEVADAYFSRASEMTMMLQKGEREGTILKGSAHYRFRTGELRTFMEMAKRAAELGSRRLTAETLRFEMATKGRESAGFE